MVIKLRHGQSTISSLASRNTIYDEIISSLKDDDISLIGVHGMAGVGKTTLVKKVYNYAVKEKLFDVIIWLVVSQDPDVTSRITRQISRALGLHDSSSEFYEMIVNSGKRVLIVLDDVWHHLDFQTLGIPMTFGHGGADPCKFLLSSRNKETLRSMHSSMKLIPVTTLPKEESSLLFNQIINTGKKSLSFRKSRPPALIEDMVETFEGLPLVINGVARLLKGASLSFWKYAADQLRKSIFQFGDGMSFFVVKFSYDCLRNEEDKLMFLLCSIILGKKIYCQDLLKYGLGLGLFEGEDAMRAARQRLYQATNSMKETYLLQDGETSQYATMDKIYHDLALKIASTKPDWFIVRDGWTIKWPKDENEMAKVTYVSLPISNVTHEFPQGLPFPNLKLLHLYDENGSKSKIADNFFEMTNREGLKVLALIKMQLLSLPSSLCVLSNMDTLCLDYCVLGDISMIGELRSLRVLSLSNTNIEQLPIQIGQLIRLCLLDLSNCFNLKVIQPTVLSSLTKLEELRMRNSFSGWEGVGNASLAELRHLNSLSALDIHIPDAEIIPEALPWDHLQRYNVIIGQDFPSSSEHGAFKDLKLKHNKGNLAGSKDLIVSLLGSCEQLWLKEFKGLGDDSVYPSFQNLKIAKIEDCPLLKSVFNKKVFQLRELEISGCTEMVAVANINPDDVKLVDGKLCDFGFPHLHSLTLQNLGKLTGFFPRVAGKRGSESSSAEANIYSGSLFLNLAIALPLLKLLKLINIPKIRHLVATTTTDQVVPLQNLETMEIADCNDLSHLFVIEGSNIDENYGGLLPK